MKYSLFPVLNCLSVIGDIKHQPVLELSVIDVHQGCQTHLACGADEWRRSESGPCIPPPPKCWIRCTWCLFQQFQNMWCTCQPAWELQCINAVGAVCSAHPRLAGVGIICSMCLEAAGIGTMCSTDPKLARKSPVCSSVSPARASTMCDTWCLPRLGCATCGSHSVLCAAHGTPQLAAMCGADPRAARMNITCGMHLRLCLWGWGGTRVSTQIQSQHWGQMMELHRPAISLMPMIAMICSILRWPAKDEEKIRTCTFPPAESQKQKVWMTWVGAEVSLEETRRAFFNKWE